MKKKDYTYYYIYKTLTGYFVSDYRKVSGMAKKYYAVKIGKEAGIYETWDQCKTMVHGYPGAVYKSFSTREEALA